MLDAAETLARREIPALRGRLALKERRAPKVFPARKAKQELRGPKARKGRLERRAQKAIKAILERPMCVRFKTTAR